MEGRRKGPAKPRRPAGGKKDLGLSAGISPLQDFQFPRGNYRLGEATVETNQNLARKIDGRSFGLLNVCGTDCQFRRKPAHLFRLANLAGHTARQFSTTATSCQPRRFCTGSLDSMRSMECGILWAKREDRAGGDCAATQPRKRKQHCFSRRLRYRRCLEESKNSTGR